MSEKKEIVNEMTRMIEGFIREENKPIACSGCGQVLSPDDVFCNRCGLKASLEKPSIKIKKLLP